MSPTPIYSAPHNGILGDASAIAGSGQINQFLGTHANTIIHQGASVLTPNGSGGSGWAYPLDAQDISQPFAMSGTTVGRVEIPLLAVGAGADLLVSLCTDSLGTPGSAGSPATVVTQTRIPASWITQMSAVSAAGGPSSSAPQIDLTGNPLAVPMANTLRIQATSTVAYPYPAATSSGSFSSTGAYLDTGGGTGYMYLVGGVDTGTALNCCFRLTGDLAGNLGSALPQPALPQTLDGSGRALVVAEPSNGPTSLVAIGGAATFGGTPSGAVYVSQIDTATGNIGAWSMQAALPENVQDQGAAAYNGFIYVVGGQAAPGGTIYNTVYYAQVQNSQITGWTASAPYPIPVVAPWVAVVGGYLFVANGKTAQTPTYTNVSYYAKINADGSLGRWTPGPPTPLAGMNLTDTALSSPFGASIAVPGSQDTFFIGFTETGPAPYWLTQAENVGTSNDLYVMAGSGMYAHYALNYISQVFVFNYVNAVPTMSVPLPAVGLTSGATYHIVVQQQGGSLVDYLVLWDDFAAVGNFALRTSPRAAYTWTHNATFHQVPIRVFDQTVIGPVLHLWSDNGARVTTIVSATTPDQRPLGVCEATRQAVALNANQGFETGLSPWTVTGGSAVQSGAEVFEGAYAAQVTPSGSDATVYLQSELLPCMPGQSVTVDGHMWFTNSVTSNASMSVAWYTLAGTLISTSSNSVSVPAATWTELSNTFTAPAAAYGFTINPTLSGTPSAAQVFYLDAVRGHATYVGPQHATVAQITADATWPAPWKGTGVVQLA